MILGQYKYIMQKRFTTISPQTQSFAILHSSKLFTPVFAYITLYQLLSEYRILFCLYLIAVGLQTKSQFQTLRVSTTVLF